MTHEQIADQPSDEAVAVAWDVFQVWTGTRDEARFRQSYLGHYPDRAAFGRQLLTNLGAYSRLQPLPDWLRAYIRFDEEAVLADFERAGYFYIFDAPNGGGTHVFDGF